MTSKEEGIQRCKAIVLRYQSLKKKDMDVEATIEQVDETLRLFPRTKEDDALYPVEELVDMYHDIITNHVVLSHVFFSGVQGRDGVEERLRLAMDVLFEYFERSGPGRAYLKALSVFVDIAQKFFRVSDIDSITRILLKSEAVLDRVDQLAIHHASDCASMLDSLNKLPYGVSERPLACKVEYFNKAISLCKKYPGVDANVLVGLYCLANSLAGIYRGENVNQASKLRAELIRTFLELKHPDRTKLDVLCSWFLQPFDITLFVLTLLPLGVKLVRELPDRLGAFLESVEECFSLGAVRFLVMMHVPDAMQLIEDTVFPESLPGVKCLLMSLIGDARDQVLRQLVISVKRRLLERGMQISEESDFVLVESWQRRLILKAVELFSAPSELTEPKGVEKLATCFQDILNGASSMNPMLTPLFELWNTQFVDHRYSWTYRLNVFNRMDSVASHGRTGSNMKTNNGTSFPPETNHVLSHFMSNRIWMHDPSRYLTTSAEEWKSAEALLRVVRWKRGDTLYKYDVDMILLLTWLRAPAVVGRLMTKSALTFLKTDLLQRLAEMLGPKEEETLFAKRSGSALARVL